MKMRGQAQPVGAGRRAVAEVVGDGALEGEAA
jgi:hypothetical protein